MTAPEPGADDATDHDDDAGDGREASIHVDAEESTPVDAETRRALVRRLAAAPGVVLCLDFDGTLAPIEADPDAPEITPANRSALRDLAERPAVRVAVVSGRARDDVRSRVGIDGITYAGNHGLELAAGGERQVHPLAAAGRPLVRRVVDEVDDRLAAIDGAFVEDKTVTATVHYRQADVDGEEIRDVVEAAASDVPDDAVRIEDGKQIWEVRPDVPWDKGRIVAQLSREADPGWLPMYVGDDTTDEDAFHAVADAGGIATHVGDADTAADYRIPDPAGVTTFLERLRDATAPERGA